MKNTFAVRHAATAFVAIRLRTPLAGMPTWVIRRGFATGHPAAPGTSMVFAHHGRGRPTRMPRPVPSRRYPRSGTTGIPRWAAG
ncbi:hypothetical protein AB0J83_32305 [Actinoplanes sp. NPDC049596]|uniref:hypothetical protein n=1 Tax=unclassified Actinoplanes TaxID=2626549 RepID=UPI003415E44C